MYIFIDLNIYLSVYLYVCLLVYLSVISFVLPEWWINVYIYIKQWVWPFGSSSGQVDNRCLPCFSVERPVGVDDGTSPESLFTFRQR